MSFEQVSATDQDEGSNGDVRYVIVGAYKYDDFTIGEDTGIIRVNKKLDFERQARYVLTIQAEDSPGGVSRVLGGAAIGNRRVGNQGQDVRYDTATVTITVTDLNDNPPVFVDSPYNVHVIENIASNLPTLLTTVTAWDADDSPLSALSQDSSGVRRHPQVRYLIKDGDKTLFRINETSGEIVVKRALDREQQAMYSLVVVAMDKGRSSVCLYWKCPVRIP